MFTLGSSAVQTPGKFFQVASNLGRRVILLAGSEAANLPSDPNVLAVHYAPHSALFPHAAAIVHQGGIGTTAEALRSGRPSLIVPFAHSQPDNAARCERLGVARILSRSALNAERLAEELKDLSHARYTLAARQLAEKLRQENGARQAARILLSAYGNTETFRNGLS